MVLRVPLLLAVLKTCAPQVTYAAPPALTAIWPINPHWLKPPMDPVATVVAGVVAVLKIPPSASEMSCWAPTMIPWLAGSAAS